jgi:putative redox protein
MNTTLTLDRNMRIIGTNSAGLETIFDTHPDVGGEDTAPTPMEVFLQAMGACSFMDVVSILRKKRKQIDGLKIEQSAERSDQHPKVITEVHLKYILKSPDAEIADLEKAIELSQTKYCGASAMFQRSGCKVTWESEIIR